MSNTPRLPNPLLSLSEGDTDIVVAVEILGLRDAAEVLDRPVFDVLGDFNRIQKEAFEASPMDWISMVQGICERPPRGYRSEALLRVVAAVAAETIPG